MEEQNQQDQGLTKKERREIRRQEKRQFVQGARRGRKTKKFFGWLIVIVLIIAGGYGLAQLGGSGDTLSPNDTPLADTVSENDHIKGNPEAAVTLVEYSDFQCPACASYALVVKQLTEQFGDQIQFVYRHFPLSRIHQNAELAGRASEAADKQGMFWEMHDLLFANQSIWSNVREGDAKEMFVEYAVSLGLNQEQFLVDIDSSEAKDKVSSDFASGTLSGVNSTPSFFLNGQKIINPRSMEEFSALIVSAITETTATSPDEDTGMTPSHQ